MSLEDIKKRWEDDDLMLDDVSKLIAVAEAANEVMSKLGFITGAAEQPVHKLYQALAALERE